MRKRTPKAKFVGHQISVDDIMDDTVTPAQLARVRDADIEQHVVEMLELSDVVRTVSSLDSATLARFAVALGRSISVSREEKRKIMQSCTILSNPKLRILLDFFEEEQIRLEELRERLRINKPLV